MRQNRIDMSSASNTRVPKITGGYLEKRTGGRAARMGLTKKYILEAWAG